MAVDGYCYPCGVEYENACPGPDDTSATMQPHPTLSYACISSGTIYAASLYWSVMTITSIGYGDISATPRNELELAVGAALMLLSGIMWADFIAGFVGFVTNLNRETIEFRQMLMGLNQFMSRQSLPKELQLRLREYFHQTAHLREAKNRATLLETMSPSLQWEVSWRINEKWLNRVWFLADAPRSLLVQLSTRVSPLVFAPSEVVPSGKLYIVHRGLALHGGRVLGSGKVWGEDSVILTSASLHSKFVSRAMNYLEVSHMILIRISVRAPSLCITAVAIVI